MGGGGLPLTGHPSVLLLLLGLGLPPAVGLPLPNQAPIPEKIPTFVLEVGVAELSLLALLLLLPLPFTGHPPPASVSAARAIFSSWDSLLFFL